MNPCRFVVGGGSHLNACEELFEATLAEGFDDRVAAAMLQLQMVEAPGLGEGGGAGAAEGSRGITAADEERGTDHRHPIVEAACREAGQHFGAAFDEDAACSSLVEVGKHGGGLDRRQRGDLEGAP